MSDYGLPNTKSVNDFIGYIRERLAQSTTSWREIAEAFAEAKEIFGGESRSAASARRRTSARARLISSPPLRRVSGWRNIGRSSRWFIAGARSTPSQR